MQTPSGFAALQPAQLAHRQSGFMTHLEALGQRVTLREKEASHCRPASQPGGATFDQEERYAEQRNAERELPQHAA